MVTNTFGQTKNFVNPTGSYTFSGKTKRNKNNVYGYFGHTHVLLLDSSHILINFFICKGAPSYNSGSFIDTLEYTNNTAIYRGDRVSDSTCKLTLDFSNKGIGVQLFSENPNWACGFGHAVDAYGFFKRIRGKIPSRNEILEDN